MLRRIIVRSSSSVGKVVYNLLSVLLQPVASLGGSLGPSDFFIFHPLTRPLVGMGCATDASRNKVSSPGYVNLILIYSMLG